MRAAEHGKDGGWRSIKVDQTVGIRIAIGGDRLELMRADVDVDDTGKAIGNQPVERQLAVSRLDVGR